MSHTPSLWSLEGTIARLHTEHGNAQVDLSHTHQGLHCLMVGAHALAGNLLGLTLDEDQVDLPAADLQDCFTRGRDLVVSFKQTQQRPFDVHIYWRIDSRDDLVLTIDAIISLQTSLLESFPQVATLSTLPISEAWHLSESGEPSRIASADEAERPVTVAYDLATALLLRLPEPPWSYLEITHPSDLGTCHLQVDSENQATLRRVLGGDFQEKGVIRRMRVRGCLLPATNDLAAAQQALKEFATAEPPLTV